MEFRWEVLAANPLPLWEGFLVTLQALGIALAIGTSLGALVCIARRSARPGLRRLAWVWILFFRATPEMILIFWAYYCIPMLTGSGVSGLLAGSVTLGLVASAYLGEIYRAGLEAVPRGQYEAARALGLKTFGFWGVAILPQALRLMLPALLNYFTELVKNTTLLAAIGVGELALRAYLLGGQTFRYVEFLTAIAVLYFLLIFPLSVLSRRLEHPRAGPA
jgi:His/Glu/Gln/Arg/opine family amino acid ABC transporter permease subunit